jgi:signal transduction histidine kinase/ActR/RegA family two-component response regulator
MPRLSLEERVIICVESAQDAARIVELVSDLGAEGVMCADYSELCDQIEKGVAVIILSELPVISDSGSRLSSLLHAQPPWSTIPTIVIPEDSASTDEIAEDLLLGVTTLERPVHMRTLSTVIRIALEARRNQYIVRDLLRERGALIVELRHEADMKNEFLATLAHELRNPLAPIRTGLEVLRRAPPGDPVARTLNMMDRQVSHLVRLIDDLLDVSRITRGKLELRKQKVPLSLLLSNAVESSRPLVEAEKHTLTISEPNELITLTVDPTRIAQVISNLLNNAAKYTPKGGIIALTARHKDDTVQIEVKDTGIGLSPEMLTKVFDMFSQVEPSMTRSQGGLGIGLTLARRLAEMHNGTVEAMSAGPGSGSTFTVTLPCDEQSHTKPSNGRPDHHNQPAPHRQSHRVLIVEDQLDIAQSLQHLLSLLGHDTMTASNGPEALRSAKDFKPELIFLDIGLPGMTGYEVARKVRALETLPKPRLIAITGWGDARHVSLAREAGFDQHLTKPVDPLEVERILQTLEDPIRHYNAHGDLPASGAALPS